MKEKPKKCLVNGCQNYSDAGVMIGDLCAPCHEMLTTGEVHPNNTTFIGDLARRLRYPYAKQRDEFNP